MEMTISFAALFWVCVIWNIMYFWFISILCLCNLECFVIVKGDQCAILGLCNLEYYVLLVYKYYVSV